MEAIFLGHHLLFVSIYPHRQNYYSKTENTYLFQFIDKKKKLIKDIVLSPSYGLS